jgi:hypothetical protein
MLVGIFLTRIDELLAGSLFLRLWVVLLVMAIADYARVVQVGPYKSQFGIPFFRPEMVNRHPFLTAEPIVWRQAVRAPTTE